MVIQHTPCYTYKYYEFMTSRIPLLSLRIARSCQRGSSLCLSSPLGFSFFISSPKVPIDNRVALALPYGSACGASVNAARKDSAFKALPLLSESALGVMLDIVRLD